MGKRVNTELLRRIDLRLKATGKSARKACRDGLIDEGSINNIRQGKTYWPTGDVLRGLARGLECKADYLIERAGQNPSVHESLTNLTPESGMGDHPHQPRGADMRDNVDDLLDMLDAAEHSKWPRIVSVYRRMTGRTAKQSNPTTRRRT